MSQWFNSQSFFVAYTVGLWSAYRVDFCMVTQVVYLSIVCLCHLQALGIY